MKKQISALIAAGLMTAIVTLVMMVTSANALLNKNGVDPSNTRADNTSTISPQDQMAQLQARIDEYAQREQQYQQREQKYQQILQNDQSQVQQAAEEVQQVQQLLFALQTRGLIKVQENGTITIIGGSGN